MDWLNHDVLDTGISIAELVVAFIGLGGGGYAGAYRATLTRTRHEDRRRLLALTGLSPEFLSGSLVKGSDGTPDRMVPLAGGSAGNRLMRALDEELKAASAIVDLLPWLDRVSWKRVTQKVDPITGWRAVKWRDRRKSYEQWFEDGGHERYGMSLKPFLDHLHRQVRPGIWRRFTSLSYKWDLVRHGPWRV